MGNHGTGTYPGLRRPAGDAAMRRKPVLEGTKAEHMSGAPFFCPNPSRKYIRGSIFCFLSVHIIGCEATTGTHLCRYIVHAPALAKLGGGVTYTICSPRLPSWTIFRPSNVLPRLYAGTPSAITMSSNRSSRCRIRRDARAIDVHVRTAQTRVPPRRAEGAAACTQ